MTDASRDIATPETVTTAAGVLEERTLGMRLREAREAGGLTLAGAAHELRIREDFLRALESDRYVGLPNLPYAQGFVRSYALYLKLNEYDAVAQFKSAIGSPPPPPKVFVPEPMRVGRWPGVGVVIASILIGGALYGIWQYYQTDRALAVVPAESAARPAPTPVAGRPPVEQAENNSRSTAGPAVEAAKPVAEPPPKNVPPPPMPEGAGLGDPRPPGMRLPPAEPPKVAEGPKIAEAGAEKKPDEAAKPNAAPSRVVIRATGPVTVTFVERSSGRVFSQYTLRAGSILIPPRPEIVAINATSAGALTIEFNGRMLKPLGAPGQPLNRFSLAPEDLEKLP
jgi:cytoskeleton protein RodZ